MIFLIHIFYMFLPQIKDTLNVSLQKLIQILNIWTQLFPYDFRNQKMMKNYRTVTNKCLNMDLNLKENIIEITQGLLINASFFFNTISLNDLN